MTDKLNNQSPLEWSVEVLGEKGYEDNLLKWAEKKPDDVFTWVAAREMSKDPLMKSYYLKQMTDCIRKNGGVIPYMKGIHYTHKAKRRELNRELAVEMIQKHPITGRFFKFLSYMPPNCFYNNLFE